MRGNDFKKIATKLSFGHWGNFNMHHVLGAIKEELWVF